MLEGGSRSSVHVPYYGIKRSEEEGQRISKKHRGVYIRHLHLLWRLVIELSIIPTMNTYVIAIVQAINPKRPHQAIPQVFSSANYSTAPLTSLVAYLAMRLPTPFHLSGLLYRCDRQATLIVAVAIAVEWKSLR